MSMMASSKKLFKVVKESKNWKLIFSNALKTYYLRIIGHCYYDWPKELNRFPYYTDAELKALKNASIEHKAFVYRAKEVFSNSIITVA